MLRMILMGDYFLPSELVDPGQEGAVPVQNRPLAKTRINAALTKRETEVLGLVAMGRRNKIIAHELGMSEHTVKLHLHHIITKLGVRNRTAATNWFLSRDDMGRG